MLATLACFVAPNAFAAGTPAGTVIPNAATLSYSYRGEVQLPVTVYAPHLIVNEVINHVLTAQNSGPLSVMAPDTGKALTFALTNTGNGTETFRLTRNNAVEGDAFDPINPPEGSIYLENGAQPGFQATGPNADTVYVPGTNDPTLLADATQIIYVVSNIPASLANGALGNLTLTASSTTPGAAGAAVGTRLVGAGQNGVDAMVGSARGRSSAAGAYLVSSVSLAVTKTVVSVLDPRGGTLVMPGTILTYRIALALTGIGVAELLQLSDPLPAETTYVPGSLLVNGAPRTDAQDNDNASFASGVVRATFGNTVAPANHVIEFKVTVN